MEQLEEIEVQEPEQQQDPIPKKRALYDAVSKKYDLGTYDDFDKKLKDPTKRKALYDHIGKEFELGTYQDFESKLSSDVKKKVGSINFEESSLAAGNAQSNGVGGEEIQTIELYTTPNGETIEDPFRLSQQYKQLSEATKEVSMPSSGKGGQLLTQVPDEYKRKEAKGLKERAAIAGIDLDELYDETKDIPDEVLEAAKPELLRDRSENNPLYQRKLANIKWRDGLEQEILKNVYNGSITPEDYKRIKNSVDKLPEFTGSGDFTNQRTAIQSLAKDIKLYGGENRDKILENFAVEVSKVYGSAYRNNFKKTIEGSPESKYLNEDAQLGIQYLEDVAPEKARQYDRLKVNPKDLEGDALKGYNHLMQTAEETGIGLQQNSVTEELNNLKRIANEYGGLTDEQLSKATELEKKQEELTQKQNELDTKYPDRIEDKVDDALQEIMGQKISGINYVGGTAFKAIKNTGQGIWEAVSTPFMSDASNTLRELSIMGENLEDNSIYHKTDKNKSLLTDTMVIEPELQKQIDEVKGNSLLNDDQKEMKVYQLLKQNTDKFGRVPIKGGKFNLNPSSILYGLSDLGTTLLPFIALEAATGGGATAGAARKFVSTFTAAAATSFHDEYASALLSGKSQSEAYKEAMGMTAISSLAMAGASTPEKIKAMLNPKTSAGKLILSMSDDAIQKVLDKGVPKGLKGMKQAFVDRAKAIPKQFAGGLKTGAEFEVAMNLANEAKAEIYDTEIDREQNFKQSLIGIGNFGIMGVGLGQTGYKSPTELQKSSLLQFGAKPKEYISVLDGLRKEGKVTLAEYDHRKSLIESSEKAYQSLPQSLSEKQKADYLYQTVIKDEATKGKSSLPPRQAAAAEKTALVADHTRGLILEPPTEKQLNDRIGVLERKLEPKKDAEGKAIELPEKEKLDYEAELEALSNEAETRKSFEKTEMNRRDIAPKESDAVVVSKENPADIINTLEGKIPAMEFMSSKSNPELALREIADQALGLGRDGEGNRLPLDESAPEPQLDAVTRKYGKEVVDKAIEMFPPEKTKTPSVVSDVVVDNPLKDVESTAKALEGNTELQKMPNVTFHGSKNKELIFGKPKEGKDRPSKMQLDFGTHFTDEGYASFYSGDKGKNHPAIIDLKDPLDLTKGVWYKGEADFERVQQLIKDLKLEKEYGAISNYDKDGNKHDDVQSVSITANKLDRLAPKKVSDALKQKGYDGIIYEPYHPAGGSGGMKFIERKSKSYIVLDNSAIKEVNPKNIAEAYHKAKEDGSNPELVKAVEQSLSKEQPQEVVEPAFEGGKVSGGFMDKVNDFKKRYQDFVERSAKYIKKDGSFKKAIPESVKEEGAKFAAENELLRTQVVDGLANLSKENKEKSRAETEKINADFEARQKELQQEYGLTNEEIIQATIDEKLDRNTPLTKDEVDFANENMFAPKGFEFNENGLIESKNKKKEVVEPIQKQKNEEAKVTSNTKSAEEKSAAEPMVSEPTSKAEGGKKEPPKEPTEPVGEGKGKDRLNDKGVLNHLESAKNVPEASKIGFREKGLKYDTKSQKEAEEVAKSVIDEYGIEDAVLLAEAQKFDGDVNSLIYAESLNRLAKMEAEAKTPEEKLEFTKKFAEVGIKYDEAARKGGRFTSAINYFYKKSPLGIAMIENAKRKTEFDEWAKPKEKSWKEFFDEMLKDENFEAEAKEYAKGEMAKERAENRKARIKKVDDAFDAAKSKFQGGAAYSTIIPPQVITAALEGMKKAYHAGEKVAKLVEDAIDYISEKLGHDTWDKEKFRNEWEEKLKDKTEKRKFTDEEIKAKILDRFRKKLKGLNDSQKEDVVRKSFEKIVENGGLDYADFKKIIADITGRSELTAEEVTKLKELVAEANKVDDAAQKARTERTQQSRKEYMAVSLKAAKAQKELTNLLYSKPNIMQRLTSMIQLNTLGVVSLLNNPVYNVWNQTTLRLPVGVVKSGVDKAIQIGSGGKVSPETNIFSAQAQVEFFKKLGLGTKEAFQQFFTGLNRPDYTAKEIQGQQIRPFSSIKDLWKHFVTKEKKLTKGQIIDKALQGSPQGIAAEVVARTLNLGDKPQRFAAEGAQAAAFAKALGLKDIDYDLFIDFPREEAYRAYKAKGLSDADAGKKADYIRDIIIKEGQRSTFQQDNMLNDVLSSAFGQLNKLGVGEGTQQLLKSVTVSPYIKIPSNAYWSYYNLVNPEIAFLQAMIYSGKAYAKRNKGDNSAAKDLNEAKYWFAHGAVGIATRAVVMSLVGQGIINTSNTGDDTKKEREGETAYEQQGTINVDKMWAAINGEDPDKVKNGLNVQLRWFGHWGTMANAIERKNEEMTPEQKEAQADFWDVALGGMEVDALKDLNQGVFGNTSSLLTSIERGDFQSYGVNLINMFANVVHPASLSQISKAQLPYVNKNKGDDFLSELKNSMLTRSSVLRNLTGQYPPSRISIWGEKMPKNDKALQFFGVSKANNDAFARPIYNDAKRTDNIAFFPPAVKPEIKRGDEIVKLPTKEAARLEEFVGQQRKNLIAPYINNMATFDGSNKTYSELSDEEKLKNLEILYKEGFKRGKELFLREYPQYKTPEDFIDKTPEESEIEENNKQLRESIKNR